MAEAAPRKPRGYVGNGHETLGSDVLAVLRALTMPEPILGRDMVARINAMRPDGWYPVQIMLDALETLSSTVGPLSLRQTGRKLFQMTHAEAFKQNATSAGDLVFGVDTLYHHANRGDRIGGWQVLEFQPGLAVLEKTTPHHCVLEEGILAEGLATLGIPVLVSQPHCFRKGDEACIMRLSSSCRDARWTGKHAGIPAR